MAATLVCCAAPIGYGPATKLVAVADALRPRGVRTVFLGEGSALEAAGRSDAFDDVVAASVDSHRARAVITAGTGLLSMMERDHLRTAQASGRRTFVADSLLWMRDHVPPVFRAATRYWAQDFIGVRGRAAGLASVVGPLVSRPVRTMRARRLVVALGGASSPLGDGDDDQAWLDLIVDAAVDSGLVADFADGATCMSSERSRERLAARHAGRGLTFVSLAPADAAALLASAAMVLAAPGLTTTLECFQLGVPTVFLPPFSYSQWRILDALRAHGLAPGAIHWADHAPGAITPNMPEDGRAERVRAVIRTRLRDPAMRSDLRAHLAAVRHADRHGLADRQRAFFTELGANGVDDIAAEIAHLCTDRGAA